MNENKSNTGKNINIVNITSPDKRKKQKKKTEKVEKAKSRKTGVNSREERRVKTKAKKIAKT
jgi:hypothetical protein